MNWNASVRQLHRWVSVVFVAIVAVVSVAAAVAEPVEWLFYLPLIPLALLLLTGLNLFVLPYVRRNTTGRTG